MSAGAAPEPRKGTPPVRLDEGEFKRRYLEQFRDPAFERLSTELAKVTDAAWDAYAHGRKAPQTRKAGPGFVDPDYDLSVDWIAAREAIAQAEAAHADGALHPRALLVNASPRSEHSCPGEVSKSHRLVETAREAIEACGLEVDALDLSRLTAEYGRTIHPCKGCFSTAAPLCHYPCSCYPNHALGQTHDWMNEIYPRWVRAHGVMVVSPVHWYSVTSPLKLLMDRMVCVDGGNPDPTRTNGKDAKRAKEIELAGWDYPQHLKGRLFATVVHGDVEGAGEVRRAISDWLRAIGLERAGGASELDRYVGYFEPYATNHEALDRDAAVQEEVRNAARALAEAVVAKREGRWVDAGAGLRPPRRK